MDRHQQKEITGSGVLLWELFKQRNSGRVGLAVILFGSQRKSGFVYSDCGGGIDDGEEIKKGALRELQEESCNLFTFQKDFLSTSVQTRRYICYNVFVNSSKGEIKSDIFKDNLTKLRNADCPYSWRETKTIRRFFIEDLIKLKIETTQDNRFNAVTTRGEKVELQSRCVGVIKQILKNGLVNLSEQTIAVPSLVLSLKQYSLPLGSRLTFLQGTKTFQVEQTFLEIESSLAYQKKVLQILNPNNIHLIHQNNQISDQSIQQSKKNSIQYQDLKMIEEQNNQELYQDVIQRYNITNQNLILKIQDPKNNRRGGGVIILATNEKGEQGFLLVKDRKDSCSDTGGSSSSHEINIMEAGIRELKEETSNTFNLCEKHLSNTHSIRIQNYLCNLVHIEANVPAVQKVFENNVKALNSLGDVVPRCWRNKKELVFFPLSKNKLYFEKFDINSDQYYLIDSNDNQQTIRDRSAIIIHSLIDQKMHLNVPISKISLEDNSHNKFIYNEQFQFLTQTQSYVFQ